MKLPLQILLDLVVAMVPAASFLQAGWRAKAIFPQIVQKFFAFGYLV